VRASAHRRDCWWSNKDARLWTEQVPDRIEHDGDGVRSDAWREGREQNEADAENADGGSVTAHRALTVL